MTTYEYSIIIPAYNEACRITVTIEHIAAFIEAKSWSAEVLVVDDGSVDGTSTVVQQLAERFPVVRLITLHRNQGKGNAIRVGIEESRGELILFADADDSTPIEDAPKLFDALRAGADVAMGSRWVDPAYQLRPQPWYRLLNGRFYSLLVRTVLGLKFKDTQNGFKAYSARAAKAIFPLQKIGGWGFDAEIIFLAQRYGFNVVEIPVDYIYYPEGSKIRPYLDGINMFLELLKVRRNSWNGTYPKQLQIAARSYTAPMVNERGGCDA